MTTEIQQNEALPAELIAKLATVKSVGVITGAGVSAESGIQTYRGTGGVYDDPVEGDRVMEAVSGHTMIQDPDRTWRAIARLASSSVNAQPNPAHRAIVAIEQKVERFALLTQNVDGLHQIAGSKNVIDIHGTIVEIKCMECDYRGQMTEIHKLTKAPRCDKCGGVLRPDVVLFNEMLPMHKVARIQEWFYEKIPDVVLAVGTTALFAYIAEPVFVAQRAGRLTIEVNPEPTTVTPFARYALRGPAGAFMPQIAEAIVSGNNGG